MDAKETLYDLYSDAGHWHAMLAAWVGRNPKKTATAMIVAGIPGAWKAVNIVGWFV